MSIAAHLARNFVIGGFIVVSISYLATFFDPLIAAIWWSFPLSLVPSLYFAHSSGKKNKFLAEFSMSTTYALSLLVISTLALAHFFRMTPDKDGIVLPILKESGVWFVFSIIFYFVVKRLGLSKKFM